MLLSFVTTLQDDTNRARNPRFYFVHAGTKPRFLTKKGASKIGDSVLWIQKIVACVLLSFVTTLQDDTKDSSMRCDAIPRNPRFKDAHTGTKRRFET